ncbi:hypothetical protein, conserved [Eimeria brunetti]|uniref:Uncharacterized protein n=1 Tax=Eimeria brunetti TaxID=51314 RepID=U6LUZ5_9EIME|nr:hypothetical protein, conserved [Eimeria brunetti]
MTIHWVWCLRRLLNFATVSTTVIRDLGCVLEEMLLRVLDEAEGTGVPDGETTRFVFQLQRPDAGSCTGGVQLEVFATKPRTSGTKEDEWLQ